MAVCTMLNWGFNFAISYTFLTLTDAITKQGAFWLYAGFGACAVAFFTFVVPEREDRSLDEFQSDLGADADVALTRERAGEREHAGRKVGLSRRRIAAGWQASGPPISACGSSSARP